MSNILLHRRRMMQKSGAREFAGLRFTSSGNTTVALENHNNTPDVKYSLDGGLTWTQWDYSAISLSDGDDVCFKGTNTSGFSKGSGYNNEKYSKFVFGGTGTIAASGNIMYLINEGKSDTISGKYCFTKLFEGCTSLTSAPELPATTLTNYCYSGMFRGCTSLTSAPELPATVVLYHSYEYMFALCTSLTAAPELPATSLSDSAYQSMFAGCTLLSYVKCLYPNLSNVSMSRKCTYWLIQVSSTGRFIKSASNSGWDSGSSGIPSGWTVEDA